MFDLTPNDSLLRLMCKKFILKHLPLPAHDSREVQKPPFLGDRSLLTWGIHQGDHAWAAFTTPNQDDGLERGRGLTLIPTSCRGTHVMSEASYVSGPGHDIHLCGSFGALLEMTWLEPLRYEHLHNDLSVMSGVIPSQEPLGFIFG